MDQDRFRQLEQKRDAEGLTDEEADELGRLIADREGKPYSNADDQPSPDAEPKAWEEPVKQGEESDQEEMASPAPADDHPPEEERAVGTERQPMPATGSGYVPPKGSDEVSG
jgi:hypothetical protein